MGSGKALPKYISANPRPGFVPCTDPECSSLGGVRHYHEMQPPQSASRPAAEAVAAADLSLAAIEGHADAWAERINLNTMIENALSPMRLNRSAPDDVRAAFAKRMKEQVDAIVRQAFIEGAVNALDGFAPVGEESRA